MSPSAGCSRGARGWQLRGTPRARPAHPLSRLAHAAGHLLTLMAEPFKNLIGAGTVRDAAAHLRRAWPASTPPVLERRAWPASDSLEFKARAMQLLHRARSHAAGRLRARRRHHRSQPRRRRRCRGRPRWHWRSSDAGLRRLGPVAAGRVRRTARRCGDPARALALPACADAALHRRIRDPAVHRAAPGAELRHAGRLDERPERARAPARQRRQPAAAALGPAAAGVWSPTRRPRCRCCARCRTIRATYVRRSVANHLNDIAKDHPQLVRRWLRRPPAGSDAAAPRAAAATRAAA